MTFKIILKPNQLLKLQRKWVSTLDISILPESFMSRFIQDINGFLVLTSIFIAYKGNSYALPV